jgi:hypothetical protein
MTATHTTHTLTNPIEAAELRHQRHVINASRSGWFWIVLAMLMLVPALLTSLGMFAAGLLDIPVPDRLMAFVTRSPLDWLIIYAEVILITMNVALYIVVLLVSLALASNSIQREKLNNTWDTLLLTNVSARQLVAGKFRASLRAMWGDHAIVGLLRLGLIAGALTSYVYVPLPPDSAPLSVHILILGVLMLVFTALDAIFNAALGVLSGLIVAPRAVALSLSGGVRLAGSAFGVWWIFRTGALLYHASGWTYLLFGTASLVCFALAALLLLRLAEIAAGRANVSHARLTAPTAATTGGDD